MRYISLVKPGILMGNSVTLLGGFFLAMHGQQFQWSSLFWAWLAMSMVIASGCILNNFIDRDIDALMERTQTRPSVTGDVSLASGCWLATALLCLGLVIMWCMVNALACYAATLGWFVYVVLYSLWFKRRSLWGTAIGGVAGAMPPVVGCLAIYNQLNLQVFVWFALLFCWQIPHSYAIALYRDKDYRAANIPVLTWRCSRSVTQLGMLALTAMFSVFVILPYVLGWLNLAYGLIAIAASVLWLTYALFGFWSRDLVLWGRRMFIISLIIINAIVIGMLVG